MFLTSDTAETLVKQALAIARAAGRRIVEIYDQDYDVEYKADKTPVTTADIAAHDIIVKGLQQLPLSFPVLSEESESIPYEVRNHWPTYWLVDPLDGTREFMRRNGEFSVNIALVADGEPVLGVVVAPVLDISYYAARGLGAWKQCSSDDPAQIHVRNAPDGGEVVVARSRCPGTGPNLQRFLDNLGEHREIPMGSSLKSCLVAEGRADLYVRLGPTSEWDTAAPQCIVEEAGGQITDTRSHSLRYNTRESLLNPHFMVFGDKTHNWSEYLPAETL